MQNIAVILAGGVGSRLGLSTPKQFFKVAGKMVIEHTIDAFEQNPHIHEIAIVSNPAYIADVENIVLSGGWKKVKKILKGGKERYDSSLSAIKAYEGREVNLVFHDAVRPLVSQRIIDDVCAALEHHQAIDVTLPAVDTIIEAEGDYICHIPDRSRLQRGQTPQAFARSVIAEAYERALKDPDFKVTDDCGVVVKYMPEVKVALVRGEESNMKLTYKEDTYLLDKFFQLRRSALPTIGEAASLESLRDKVAVVFGGSYGIGKDTASLLQEAGAHVHCFARSSTNTDVAKRDDVQAALRGGRGRGTHRLRHRDRWHPQPRTAHLDGARRHTRCRRDQLHGHHQHRPRSLSLSEREQRQTRLLHLVELHPWPRVLQHLLFHEGRYRQFRTSHSAGVGKHGHHGELHQPRAHQDPYACQELRHRAR